MCWTSASGAPLGLGQILRCIDVEERVGGPARPLDRDMADHLSESFQRAARRRDVGGQLAQHRAAPQSAHRMQMSAAACKRTIGIANIAKAIEQVARKEG